MQYAINKLDFKPEKIVMFGWSIGGYSAAWAAMNYPVKGLVSTYELSRRVEFAMEKT